MGIGGRDGSSPAAAVARPADAHRANIGCRHLSAATSLSRSRDLLETLRAVAWKAQVQVATYIAVRRIEIDGDLVTEALGGSLASGRVTAGAANSSRRAVPVRLA
jgi:hypothetical protein